MQLIRCSLLKNSEDDFVRRQYDRAAARHSLESGLVWRATRKFADIDSQVSLSLRFPRAEGRLGLGAGVFNAEPSQKQRRHHALVVAAANEEEKHVAHAHGLG